MAEKELDTLRGSRVCNLSLMNNDGFGFTTSPNKTGTHQITSVEARSPAEEAGLKSNDLILRVNDIPVLGERYSKIVTIIQNESERGQIKLEVIEPSQIPSSLRKSFRIKTSDEAQASENTNEPEALNQLNRTAKTSRTTRDSKDPFIVIPFQDGSGSASSHLAGSIKGSRICTLFSRPDYKGFGFSMLANLRGPHKISEIKANSPADEAGLRVEDLILKVNDLPVVGERFPKIVTLLKKEFERGQVKLEVIAPSKCPPNFRNISIARPTTNDNIEPNSIRNLREIFDQALKTVHEPVLTDARINPFSMYNLSAPMQDYPVRETVTSYGSIILTESEKDIRPKDNPSKALVQKCRFKRCTIRLLHNQNFGFTYISMTKPKFMVFSIDHNSPAYKANLRTSDVVIQMDGTNIRRMKLKKVNRMLKDAVKNGQIELVVINIEGYMYYKTNRFLTNHFSQWNKLITNDNTDLYSYP